MPLPRRSILSTPHVYTGHRPRSYLGRLKSLHGCGCLKTPTVWLSASEEATGSSRDFPRPAETAAYPGSFRSRTACITSLVAKRVRAARTPNDAALAASAVQSVSKSDASAFQGSGADVSAHLSERSSPLCRWKEQRSRSVSKPSTATSPHADLLRNHIRSEPAAI